MFLHFFQDSNCLQRGGGSNIVIFQGGPDSVPHTPSHHHHTHLDQRMPMSDILIALLKASKERRYWHRVRANWKYCASFSSMIKQVRGAAEFVCGENNQRLFPRSYQIKSWSYGKICLFIISRLLIVFCATGADILNTTYHVNLLWRTYTLPFSYKV